MHQPDLACDSSLTLSCHRSSWQTPQFWPGFSSNVCFQPCKFLLPEQSTPSFSCLCAKVLPPGCSYPVSVTIRRHFLLACPCPVGSPLPPWLFPSSRSMTLTVPNPFSSKGGGCILHCTFQKPAGYKFLLLQGSRSVHQGLAIPRTLAACPRAGRGEEQLGGGEGKYCKIPPGKLESRGKVVKGKAWRSEQPEKAQGPDLQGPCDHENLYFGLLT